MANKAPLIERISLKGLVIAPSQVWGAIRLVPLLRQKPREDLRLFKREYNSDITSVSVKKDINYISYIPHGLVLTWSDDGSPVAAIGGQLINEGKKIASSPVQVQILHRMAKREEKNALRLLPLHLAMEGFLSMFFSGPTIAWKEYSKQALSQGLSPRVEWSIRGSAIDNLENGLRVFEIHENQVGVLLFVSEILASAFILPTPDDYRSLHTSLLEDFYGETFYHYGYYGMASNLEVKLDESSIHNLTDLEQALVQMRSEWSTFQGFMAGDILNRHIESKRVYTAGRFSLQHFITDLSLTQNNYIGEVIIDESGELQYLKIYGLSNAQTKRVYLLKQLAANNWDFEYTAHQQGDTLAELVYRMEKAGFGYLINNQLREKCIKMERKERTR